MIEFIFPSAAIPSLPVSGIGARYPVRRIWCVGRNYLAHVREMGNDEREPPFFFAKHADMIVPNGATITYPSLTNNLQHEIELVVAIAAGGTSIPENEALKCVFGYAVGLDLTRRDLQNAAKARGQPWEVGKSFEGSAPCAALTPAAVCGHFVKGRIAVSVNGMLRQQSDLAQMIWSVPEIVSQLSRQVVLAPGDLIFTGTPEGVGPIVPGDALVGEIDGLESLRIAIA